MDMKEIDNEDTRKANATRRNLFTIHTTQININKYIEHIPSKPATTSMREKEIDKYANAKTTICAECTSNNVLDIVLSREPSTLRTFGRLFVLDYKNARQSRQRVSKNSVCLI